MSGGADVVGQLGPLPIYVFGLAAALGFAAGTAVSLVQARRLGLDPAVLFQAAPLVMLAGVLGGRLGYVLVHWRDYRGHPAAVLHLPEGGFVLYGGLVAGAGALVWWARRAQMDPWRALDAAAPGLALGQAIGLVGAALPAPATACGIILSYGLFFYLWRLGTQWPARGRLFFAYLFLHGFGWLVIDVWTPAQRALGLTLGQWAALAAMIAAGAGFAWGPRRWLAPRRPGGRWVTRRLIRPEPYPVSRGRQRMWGAGAWLGGLALLLGLHAMRWL